MYINNSIFCIYNSIIKNTKNKCYFFNIWYPRVKRRKYIIVKFIWDECEIDQIPDCIIRIYIYEEYISILIQHLHYEHHGCSIIECREIELMTNL